MSSLSTLPKGDSAWLLRKSIQRIMQQVSVLETNIGSSTTGNSANTQVIFNDNGTLRGDTGLTFNKTTDTLGTGRLTTSGDAIVCSSTGDFYVGTTLSPQFKVERATGSATISGDLTVDTNTLKVDSANNRVGIGTASPISQFANTNTTDTITGTVTDGFAWRSLSNDWAAAIISRPASGNAYGLRAHTGGATASDYPLWLSAGASSGNTVFAITGNGIFTFADGAGGTRMTLNSTGLGVGIVPSGGAKLAIRDSGANDSYIGLGANNDIYLSTGTSGVHYFRKAAAAAAMTLDASGRLLVGPTSANASGGVLQLSSGITFPATQVASSDANTLDDYEEGSFIPAIEGQTTAGTGTYSIQVGRYTKIGNLVTVQIHLNWTAHTGTGNMLVSGLPFTSSGVGNLVGSASIGYIDNLALSAGNVPLAYVLNANTRIQLVQTPTGGGSIALVPMDTAATIVITATYMV